MNHNYRSSNTYAFPPALKTYKKGITTAHKKMHTVVIPDRSVICESVFL